VGQDDEDATKIVWQLLSMAQGHYQSLVKTLYDLTGIPVTLSLSGVDESVYPNFSSILQKESSYQQETLKLLERAIEVFGEEQELADKLTVIRKDLLDNKKRMKHLAPQSAEKSEPVKTAPEKTESHTPVLVKN
jgi:hypothetical protein